MALRVSTWYDLRDFLREQESRLARIQAELSEVIEANEALQKQMAELCAEHGITLEED
jgi:pyridoxine/pyridoxamine 5'-phosphate oxidase